MKILEKKAVFLIGAVLLLCLFSSIQFNFMDNSFMGDNKQDFEILKISNSVINVTTPENITYTAPMEGYYPGTFGFETDAIGESQPMMFSNSYALDCNGSVIAEIDGHKKVFNVSDNNAAGSAIVMQRFNDPGFDNQTFGTVEFWFRVEPGNVLKNTEFRLNWGYGKDDAAIVLRISGADQQWQFNNGTWNQIPNIPDPLNNTWHHIRINFRCFGASPYLGLQENKFEILIDGINSESLNFYTSTTEIVMFIPMYTQGGGYQDNYAYCDAIGYSWDPNYNIGENLYEGLLLSFEKSITLDWICYSLDKNANKTIWGNTTISLPNNGLHSIQVSGNDSIGTDYSSDIRYFTVKDPITIITPENITYSEPMSGYYPSTFGFENDTIGEWPDGWNIHGNVALGGTAQVLDVLDGNRYVVELYDTSSIAGWNVQATRVLDHSTTYGDFELWVRTNDTSKESAILGMVTGLDDAFTVKLVLNNWTDFGGNTLQKMGGGFMTPPINNTWYHVRIAFETTSGNYENLGQWEYKIWVNGEESVPQSFDNNYSPIDKIRIRTQGTDADYHTYFDAVGYSWHPDYNIGDNEEEGLLLSFETEFTPDWLGYSLDGQTNKTISEKTTISFPIDGLHTIQVYGNDSLGTMYQSIIQYFLVDTTSPVINVVSPSPDEFFGSTSPDFQISFTELNLDSTWYYLGPGTNEIIFSGITGIIDQIEWDKLGDGLVTIRFYINDTGGIESFAEVIVQKELTPPTSSISFTPYITPNIVNTSTTFSLAANDGTGSGVTVLRYRINNSIWYDYTGPFDLSSYSYGYYLITYQAIDAVGNFESENTLLVLLEEISSELPPIPGFNIFLILSLIGLVSLVLIKRYKK